MREVFDVVLMGRANGRRLQERQKHGWWDYLERVFAENRPWSEAAEAMILARSESDRDRGAAWFLFERKDKHQAIAEAVSPSLFGVQIQCAQCHDHPSVVEIEQRHYWGLVAFFNRGKNQMTKRGPQIAESAVGGFAKFTDLTGDSNVAELTFFKDAGEVTVEETAVNAETKDAPELYDTDPPQGLPKEPRFSRRKQFAEKVMRDNRRLSQAMVNRIWALLIGRGLVHPVDKMDSEHEPSHPELLKKLSDAFHKSGGDVRGLVRAIVNSKAYQLSMSGSSAPDHLFARALEKPLTAEDLYRSMRVALNGNDQNEDAGTLLAFQQVFPEVFPVEIVSNIKQSLMLSNHPGVVALTAAEADNLTARLIALDDARQQAKMAVQTILGREPDADEWNGLAAYLEHDPARKAERVPQMVWALMTSPEFRYNH